MFLNNVIYSTSCQSPSSKCNIKRCWLSSLCLLPKTFKLFGFQSFDWAYLMKVISEMPRVCKIRYLRLYWSTTKLERTSSIGITHFIAVSFVNEHNKPHRRHSLSPVFQLSKIRFNLGFHTDIKKKNRHFLRFTQWHLIVQDVQTEDKTVMYTCILAQVQSQIYVLPLSILHYLHKK